MTRGMGLTVLITLAGCALPPASPPQNSTQRTAEQSQTTRQQRIAEADALDEAMLRRLFADNRSEFEQALVRVVSIRVADLPAGQRDSAAAAEDTRLRSLIGASGRTNASEFER